VDSDVEVARARLGRSVGGRWVLERVLGTGGMGAVYAGRSADGSVAAIKILHPEMGARRDVRERFLREGSAANKIGHPGVVQMLGQGDGEEAFLAMELLAGETLRERVHRHGRLPLDEVLDYAAQVLAVLVAAHERGVVHRDLKPDNLFVTLDNRIKVLDFGLARLLDGVAGGQQTRTGVALGTLSYMAPEQALGRRAEIDGRVDLFALGATMFRVLSGRRVHEAESEAELLMAMASRPAPPLRAVAPEVPDGVAAVVDLSLAFSRDARYPDARSMLADVQAVRRGSAPPYATARLAARDERTRAEQPGNSQRTQPLATNPPPTSQRTVPLAAYTEARSPFSPRAVAPAPSERTAREETAPWTPAVTATRTEPLPQVPFPVTAPLPAAALPSVPVPAAVPSASPAVVLAPPSTRSRRSVVPWLVVGALAGGTVLAAVGYAVLSPKLSAVAPAASALPAPLSSADTAHAPPAPTSAVARPEAAAEGHARPHATVHAAAASAKASASSSAPSVPSARASPALVTTTSSSGAGASAAAPLAAPLPAAGSDAGAPARSHRGHAHPPHG
jgi:serine/threonine-protein kinase